jgi:hypothetical protein
MSEQHLSQTEQLKMKESLELETLDFSNLQLLEDSIAPIFLVAAAAGGVCAAGGTAAGCKCSSV